VFCVVDLELSVRTGYCGVVVKLILCEFCVCSPSISQERRESDHPVRPGVARPPFQVFTMYGGWGRCDRCGPPGEQVRVGLCYVHSPYLNVRYRTANQSVVSCGSGGVPRAFGLSQRSKRPVTRLEVRVCHVTCPPQATPTSSMPSMMDILGIR